MAAPALVAEDWTFDPLEPAGAVELYRRLHEAEPRRVRRTELEGHVGLTARELYELGCTLGPLDARRLGGMIAWRVVVVAAVLLASLGIAAAVMSGFDVLGIERGDDDPPRDLASNLGLLGFFVATAYGGLALMRLGIRRLRALAAARRRAGARAAPRTPSRRSRRSRCAPTTRTGSATTAGSRRSACGGGSGIEASGACASGGRRSGRTRPTGRRARSTSAGSRSR